MGACHTPEPWTTDGYVIKGLNDVLVIPSDYYSFPADRYRIVACVNAMANIPDPGLFTNLAKQLVMAASEPCGCADNVALAERCRRIMGA